MKINKILPIITMLTVGSIAMPLASCGCGSHSEDGDWIKFDKIYKLPGVAVDFYTLSTSEMTAQGPINFFTMEADKEYEFLIDLNWYPWTEGYITEPSKTDGFIVIGSATKPVEEFSNIEISIDGTPLSPTERGSLEDKVYYWDDGDQAFYFRFNNINKQSSIKMKLQLSETTTDMYGFYYPDWE